jgi:hypothetical protein
MGVSAAAIILFMFVLGGAPGRAAAEALPFTLDALAAGREVVLAARANSSVPLNLVRTAKNGSESIDLELTSFADESGRTVEIPLRIGEGNSSVPGLVHRGVRVGGPVLRLRLAVPDLLPLAKYTGLLVASAERYDTAFWRISLNASIAQPATLTVTPRALTLGARIYGRPGGRDGPDALVTVADKAGLAPLDGITVRQDEASAGFDLGHLDFWLNGVKRELTEPWSTSPATSGALGIRVRNLPAGEHTTTLRFLAANSKPDDAGQKLALTVRVRHSFLWPLGLLLLALGLSFATTKALTTIRQRVAFMARVRELTQGWLAEMEPVLAVVWVRDVLHQADALSRRYWLTGEDRIEARLAQVAALMDVLKKVRDLGRQFERHALPDFVKVRAESRLGQILRDLDGSALADADATRIKSELDALADWIVATKQQDCYWASLAAAIDELHDRIVLAEVPDPDRRRVIEDLDRDVVARRTARPADLRAMIAVEEVYARLKILWERREQPELADLVQLQRSGAPLRAVFTAADEAVWQRLTATPPTLAVAGKEPGDTLQAYELALVQLKAGAGVAGTYLFEHALVYHWSFEQRAGGRADTFTGRSREPSAVAYPNRLGGLVIAVEIEHPQTGQRVRVNGLELRVVASDDFKASALFEAVELTSFALAAAVALVSGLSLLYAKNATFGSAQDYLGLFLWGVGVDQGKNLIQMLKS